MKNEGLIAGFFITCLCVSLYGEVHDIRVNQANDEFWVINEGVSHRMDGMLMICPAHAHGDPQQAFDKLTDLIKQYQGGKPTTTWVCRAAQIDTLKQFSPLVEQVAINPFVTFDFNTPQSQSRVWPKVDHPTINQLRVIRESTKDDTRLLACLDLRGEPNHFEKREATFEEVQWMVFAIVGSRFQGVIWRANRGVAQDWKSRFVRFEKNLLLHAKALGKTKYVDWVQVDGNMPVVALNSGKQLFVCLLHPEYMRCDVDKKNIVLPLEPEKLEIDMKITLPEGSLLDTAKTFNGFSVRYKQNNGVVQLKHRLKGGGDMLVFTLNDFMDSVEAE